MNKSTATISEVKEAESIPYGDGKTFDKQVFQATIEGDRQPTYLEFEMVGDMIGKVSASDVGRKADIAYFLNGRKGKEGSKYEDRVFLSLKYASHEFVDGEGASEPDPMDGMDELPADF
jgi:hypothetical protein